MGTILTAIVIMTGLGAFFGVGLAIANKFLKVEEDPRLDVIEDMLPGAYTLPPKNDECVSRIPLLAASHGRHRKRPTR